jgi:hypothetical protein
MLKPVFHRRYPTEIVGHVLLTNGSHGDLLAVAVPYRRSKNSSAHEDTFAVMPQGAMPEVGKVRLAFIKPIMQRQVIFGLAAE